MEVNVKTIEQIAREAAARYWDGPVSAGGGPDAWKNELSAIIVAAIEQALREVPAPGPVSEERLEEISNAIRDFCEQERRDYNGELLATTEMMVHQRQHIDHLTRILQDCSADGLVGVRQAGYAAGHLAGWKEGAEAQRESEREYWANWNGLGAVPESPLVPHPTEEATNAG